MGSGKVAQIMNFTLKPVTPLAKYNYITVLGRFPTGSGQRYTQV